MSRAKLNPARDSTLGDPDPIESTTQGRLVAVDNLKALLVAWVIGGHTLAGYAAIGGWPYDEVQEGTLPPTLEFVLSVLLGPGALFAMGTFFFISGLFAPRAIAKAGPGEYAISRLIRLGIPWLVFMLLIWPFFMWLAYLSAGYHLTFWQAFLGRTPFLDSGPIWFIQVLMYTSLGYALWHRLGWGSRLTPTVVRGRHLVLLGILVAASSFVLRLEFPARSQQILDLHLWQWPQLICMFALGAMVANQGWAATVPASLARRCWIVVAATFILAPIAVWALGITSFVQAEPTFLGGWRLQAVSFDVVEATLVVAGSVGMLWLAQRYLTWQTPLARRIARAAYAAFMLQVPVLLSLEIAARPLPVPITVKAAAVGILAIVCSFGLGSVLVSHTPLGRLV